MNYLVRRCAVSAAKVLAASILSYFLFSVVPGDYFSAERFDPQRSTQYVDKLALEKGLDRSWPRRYAEWAASCVRGDCGTSLAYGISATRLIGPRLRKTLEIAIPALVLAWMAGLGLTWGSLRFRRWRLEGPLEQAAAGSALVPEVIVISLLLWAAVAVGMPVSGAWLPILGLAFAMAPVVYLHASSSLRRATQLLFVQLARRRGIGGARLWIRYVLPAAASSLISLGGLSLATAIGSSMLVEVLTGWPGLGPLFLEGVQARDYPVVQTVLVMLAAVLTVSNLAADLLLYRVDPRIRVPR